ncbi:MAG: SMP-30/gluconolactonase/LRE family protein [Terracidiphilus sp.]
MNWPRLLLLAVLTIACGGSIAGQQRVAAQKAGRVPLDSTAVKLDRLDPAIDQIVPKDAKLERIATGFKWVEGPVWIEGSLYFAEIPSNTIRKWTPGFGVSKVLGSTGYQGMRPYGGPEPGSNGMTLDVEGRLTIAGHARRDVYRIDSPYMRGPWTVLPLTMLADSYQGKKLNSPNDLVYRSDGSLYFTDPPYGLRTQKDTDPEKELKVNGVYRIPHAFDQKSAEPTRSELQLLISDLPRPNGIAFSPDEKVLYVDNSEPKKIWMRYRVQPDGSLTDAKLFYDATSDTRQGAPDGMKVDEKGNVYSTGPGGVWIFSPEGKPLGTIVMPEKSANVAWGGPDRKTLYITASTSIYRIHLMIAGAPLVRGR